MTRNVTVTAVLATSIILLFTVDKLLARIERDEIQGQADADFATGMRLLRARRAADAVEQLRHAHSLVRTRRDYLLGLSEALAAAGHRDEAEAHLQEVLRDDSNDGRANLLFARLLVSESRTADAVTFYRRAIYGKWPRGGANEPVQVRRELAQYLARVNRRRDLLSELLLLQDAAANDLALEREIAPLFLAAGSAQRAEEAWRNILRQAPNDRDAYRGLAEAHLSSGDYRSAETALLRALRSSPADPELTHRLKFANDLAMLDPTSRHLSEAERLARATRLLQAAQSELAGCTGVAAADDAPKHETAEERLTRVEEIWSQRMRRCPAPPANDDVAANVIRKLQQTQ